MQVLGFKSQLYAEFDGGTRFCENRLISAVDSDGYLLECEFCEPKHTIWIWSIIFKIVNENSLILANDCLLYPHFGERSQAVEKDNGLNNDANNIVLVLTIENLLSVSVTNKIATFSHKTVLPQ